MNLYGFGQPGIECDNSMTTGVQNCNDKNPNSIPTPKMHDLGTFLSDLGGFGD